MQMEGVEEFMPNRKKRNPFAEDSDSDEEKLKRPVIKSVTDLQRLKLEKLMKNPEKPVIIPELPKEKDYLKSVPNFVRNVMGSSAGAGSGEFHVYRHLRRKEYARQKYMKIQTTKDQLDAEYQEKLERNRLNAEEKTAKKRAKRQKKKQKQKQRGKRPKTEESNDAKSSESDNDSEGSESKESENLEAGAVESTVDEKGSENDGISTQEDILTKEDENKVTNIDTNIDEGENAQNESPAKIDETHPLDQ